MGRISSHFRREEFSCNCGCGWDTVDAKLIHVLEFARHHFNAPIKINSGCRCKVYNQSVGGSSGSQHRFGKAADIVVHGVKASEVQEWLDTEYHDALGIGSYTLFPHVDVRDKKARWDG